MEELAQLAELELLIREENNSALSKLLQVSKLTAVQTNLLKSERDFLLKKSFELEDKIRVHAEVNTMLKNSNIKYVEENGKLRILIKELSDAVHALNTEKAHLIELIVKFQKRKVKQ